MRRICPEEMTFLSCSPFPLVHTMPKDCKNGIFRIYILFFAKIFSSLCTCLSKSKKEEKQLRGTSPIPYSPNSPLRPLQQLSPFCPPLFKRPQEERE